MPNCKILESFVGSEDEVKKYGGQNGVIPWAKFTRTGQFVEHNVIELTEARALELQQKQIVKIVNDRKPEPLNIPNQRLLDTKDGFVDKLDIQRAERASAKAAAETPLPEGLTLAESVAADQASDHLKSKGGK